MGQYGGEVGGKKGEDMQELPVCPCPPVLLSLAMHCQEGWRMLGMASALGYKVQAKAVCSHVCPPLWCVFTPKTLQVKACSFVAMSQSGMSRQMLTVCKIGGENAKSPGMLVHTRHGGRQGRLTRVLPMKRACSPLFSHPISIIFITGGMQ